MEQKQFSRPHIRDYAGKHIHMIGIGGSSMSGLAQMLIAKGYTVSGSDRTAGYLIGDVRAAGAEVFIGHAAEQVHGADLVVYTGAAAADNPERVEADRLGIPSIERSVLLGQLMEGYPQAVGISGAHGKTSTTAMLSQMLVDCGLDPSVHIGGKLDAIGGSTRIGKGDAFLAEACEFRRSFLEMRPTIAVVLNIDADHLDCYKDIDEIEATFGRFMHLVPDTGAVIGKGTDERVVRQMKTLSCRALTFGLTAECDFHPASLTEDDCGYASFDLMGEGKLLAHVKMQVPGAFNVENGLAALTCAYVLGADMEKAAASLSRFTGAHRRFEKTDEIDGAAIYHDYGHNPTEMRNAVSIARKQCKGKLYAVMQPHTFSRVRTLFDAYLTCTEQADVTVVMDICAAREKDPGDLNSGMLVEGMKAHGLNAVWTPSFDDTEKYLREHLRPGDLAITMGCGDVNMLNEQIHQHELEKRCSTKGEISMTWHDLYDAALRVQNGRTISPFIDAGGVAAAILTKQGHVYVGVCIDTACSLGMCAERNAIASMITHGESQIDKVVAVMPDGRVGSPCGSCREMMMQLDKDSGDIEILLSLEPLQTIRLKELVPDWWGRERFAQ